MLAFGVVQARLRFVAVIIALTVVALLRATAATGGKLALHVEADTPHAARGGESGLIVWAEIEPGWHINAHAPTERFLIPTEVTLTLPPAVTADTPNFPKPNSKAFAFAQGKELLVYEGKVGITVGITVPADFIGSRVRVEAALRYQACNDSTCLPPATATAELLIPVAATAAPAAGSPSSPRGIDVDVGGWIARRGLAVALLLVVLLGVGLNLTPCVYPLISVTLAYFGGQGHHRPARVALLAATYVLGITVSFSVVGVAAALSGGLFGAALQRPPVLLFIAAVLVTLALSSFGLYQLQPPAWVMRRVGGAGRGAAGALFMGLTMGVVAAPCVGPVVLGLLVFVGSQASVVLGVELFFALGLGMGLPYMVLALAAGSIKRLPRSGDWLLWIERFFGFMLLGLAAHFLSPLLPASVGRLSVPVLMACAGIYLGFIDHAGRRLPRFRPIQRGAGIAAVALAVWLAVPQQAESSIRWEPLLPQSLAAARSAGRPMLIDFMADWCVPCHQMERTTFRDPDVQREAERFAMLKADITRETDETTALTTQYDVRGVPTVIVLDPAGHESQRIVGYVGPEELLEAMRKVR